MHRTPVVAVAVLAWWLAVPHGVDAVSSTGWSLTANPSTVTSGVTTDIQLRLTDTDGSGDIGCMRMSVPAAFAVSGVAVIATSADTPWTATQSGAGPTAISVFNPDGSGKLRADDWVDFRVTVDGQQPGSYSWVAEVVQDTACSGDTFLEPINLPMMVAPPAATPTSAPTAPPATPAPTAPPAAPTAPPATPAPTPAVSPRLTAPPSATPTSTASIPPSAPSPTATSGPGEPSPDESPAGSDSSGPPLPSIGSDGTGASGEGEGTDRNPTGSSADDPGLGAAGSAWAPTAGDPGAPDADLAIAFEALGALGGVHSWFVPGLVVGVPGLLLILIVTAHVALGAAWVPNVGRLLGPAPPERSTDEHLWWAAGGPIAE